MKKRAYGRLLLETYPYEVAKLKEIEEAKKKKKDKNVQMEEV